MLGIMVEIVAFDLLLLADDEDDEVIDRLDEIDEVEVEVDMTEL